MRHQRQGQKRLFAVAGRLLHGVGSGGSWPSAMDGTMSVPRSMEQDLDHRQREWHREQDVAAEGMISGTVADEHVVGELAHVGREDGPALLTPATMDAKVSSGRMTWPPPHDVRPALPIATAHVGRLQRWRVVHPVAGDGDDQVQFVQARPRSSSSVPASCGRTPRIPRLHPVDEVAFAPHVGELVAR